MSELFLQLIRPWGRGGVQRKMLFYKLTAAIRGVLKARGYLLSKSLLVIVFFVIVIIQKDVIAETVTATSSLPSGCSDCPTPLPAPTIDLLEYDNSGDCTAISAGITTVNNSPVYHSYTLSTPPCFANGNGEWKASLDSVTTSVGITRSCPVNPPTVLTLEGIAAMTKTQACDKLVQCPDPVGIDNIWNATWQSNCWNRYCVAVHEEVHMYIEWIQLSLEPEINNFVTFLNSNGVAVNCNTATTLNCASAITQSIQAGYDTQWQARVTAAYTYYGKLDESRAYFAQIACQQTYINALVTKCNE
jgi:hypothetical protein